MKELTSAEEQIMHVLWELNEGVVRDVIDQLPEPKPAYNTVSTIIRILEKKGVVDHKAIGKTHIYFPILQKEEYMASQTKGLLKRFFDNNPKQLLSYFAEQEDISLKDLNEIMELLKKK